MPLQLKPPLHQSLSVHNRLPVDMLRAAQERVVLPDRWVLPGGSAERSPVLPGLLQLVLQHQQDMEEDPLQLCQCDGERDLQLQNHLPNHDRVLQRR